VPITYQNQPVQLAITDQGMLETEGGNLTSNTRRATSPSACFAAFAVFVSKVIAVASIKTDSVAMANPERVFGKLGSQLIQHRQWEQRR
jgi:hypothetical protein